MEVFKCPCGSKVTATVYPVYCSNCHTEFRDSRFLPPRMCECLTAYEGEKHACPLAPELKPIDDPVNHPKHYAKGKRELIGIFNDLIFGWNLGYYELTIIKYLVRWKDKNGVQDLRKARWYMNKFTELMEELEAENKAFEQGG